MSYLRNMGLAGDVRSPQDTRFAEIVGFVTQLRREGKKSDADILALLSKPSGLSRISHPCANFDGKNICTQAEINKAMGLAAEVSASVAAEVERAAAKARAAKGGSFSPTILLIAGGAIAALWFLSKRKM